MIIRRFLALSILVVQTIAASDRPEVFAQLGHSSDIISLSCSFDGKYIVSSSTDKTVILWEVASGRQAAKFSFDRQPRSAALLSDGSTLVTVDEGGHLNFRDIRTGRTIADLVHVEKLINAVAWSPDGKYVFTAGASKLVIWDLGKRSIAGSIQVPNGVVWNAEYSADGTLIAFVRDDDISSRVSLICVLDVKTKTIVKKIPLPGPSCRAVAISPDKKYLLVASGDDENNSHVRVVQASNGKVLKDVTLQWPSQSVAISSDGSHAAVATTAGVVMFDVPSWERRETLPGTEPVIYAPRGEFLAYSNNREIINGIDNYNIGIDLAEPRTGNLIRRMARNVEWVKWVADGSTGRDIVVSGFRISHWDLSLGKKIHSTSFKDPTGAACFASALSPDGSTAIEQTDDGLRIWDVPGEKIDYTIPKEDTTYFNTECFSHDGTQLLMGMGDGRLSLWDMRKKAIARRFQGHHKGWVSSLAFSPDDKYAFSASDLDDKSAKMWNVATGVQVKTFDKDRQVSALAVSPDGKYLLTGGSGTDLNVILWNISTGVKMKVFQGHQHIVQTIAFSHDGQRFISGSFDNAVFVWDIGSGKKIRSLEGHSGNITSVQFSPDDSRAITVSADGTTRVWEMSSGKELAQLVTFNDGEWVVVTPQGYFDASANGAKYLNVSIGSKVYSIDNFYEKFFNPSYVAAVLQGKTFESTADIRKGMALPPQVKITSPARGTEFKTDALTITVSATDMGGGIDEIRLYQNGKMVSGDQRGMKGVGEVAANVRKSFEVTLLTGSNTFRAVAFNRERTESNPDEIVVELNAAQAASELYLFAIGINEYKNSKYNLNYGRGDAAAFASTLAEKSKTIFKRVVQYRLFDGEATKPSIESMFRTIAAATRPEDTFVFFYAGHGVMSEGSDTASSDFYLIPADVTQLYGNDAMLAGKGISAAQLKAFCTSIKAQKQLVVLDACQSGGAVASFATRGASEERAIMQLARSAGTILLASTGTEQFATEFSALSHGVFTYALLKGLDGDADGGNPKDGKITVKELEAYLNDQVPELTKKYRGTAQYPNSYARGQDFPLGMK